MRYLPKSPAERVDMLGQIGVSSIDELFSMIPAEYRLDRDLDIPRQMGESEIVEWFRDAAANTPCAIPASSAPAPIATTARSSIDSLVPAWRIPHQLHPLPGRDFAGHATGNL